MVEKRTRKVSAARKDILRTISHNLRRFISIAIIVTLGVMMFSALYASCMDLRKSADSFYDNQNLHDLSVVSTLGLTDEDIKALAGVDGVETAEGIYKENASMMKDHTDYSVSLETIPTNLDQLYIKDGILPKESGEAAVSWKTAEDTGLKTGDIFSVQADDGDHTGLKRKKFKVTAVVIDPTDITNPSGSMTFRNENIDDRIFILKDDLNGDVYAEVRLTLKGADALFCYSDEYTNLTNQVKSSIEETIQRKRESTRTSKVRQDAQDLVNDAVDQINERLNDAQQEIDDGQTELNDQKNEGEAELANGKAELDQKIAEGTKQLQSAQASTEAQFSDALKKLQDGQSQLETGQKRLDNGQLELNQKKQEADQAFGDAQKQLDDSRNAIDTQLETISEKLDQTSQITSEFPDLPAEAWNPYLDSCRQANMQAVAEAVKNSKEPVPVVVDFPEDSGLKDYADQHADQMVTADTINSVSSLAAGIVHTELQIAGLEAQESSEEVSQQLTVLQEQLTVLKQQETQLIQSIPAGFETEWDNYKESIKNVLSSGSQSEVPAFPDMIKNYLAEQSLQQIAAGIAQLQDMQTVLNQSLVEIDEGQKKLDAQKSSAYQQIADGQSQLNDGREELEKNKAVLAQSWNDYNAGKAEAEQKISDSWNELELGRAEGEQKLADGRKQLDDGIQVGQKKLDDASKQLSESRKEAENKISQLQDEVNSIKPAQWYLYDRMSLEGYSDLKSDADSIEAIGNVFPVLFLAVAVLICLTAVMRMVEEDRGLIGTYKSLGFHNHEIMKKYLWFSLGACIVGGILGTIFAFIGLPSFIIVIFHIMYALPQYQLHFLPLQAVLGIVLFFACILITTVAACRNVLKETPASLMRPKSPKAGSKVFLERIQFVWKHMSFLNKVTARNLFRYKGRMFMTIIGVSGCMALLLFGFAIRDSVHDLNGRQYGKVFHYDILAAGAADDYEKIKADMSSDHVKAMTGIQIEQVTLNYEDQSISAQLMVIPDDARISDFISFYNTKDQAVSLENGKILVTQNASNVLGFKEGDTLNLQRSNLSHSEIPASTIVRNYLSNYVYMRASTYEKYFGHYEANGVLAILKENVNQRTFADDLNKQKEILSVVSAEKVKNDFTSAYLLIDIVVYVIIFMSAALAFTVLFTLSTTNISERERELATIKVLGFYDNEVHAYINKETWILTGIGILLGIPLGYVFAQTLTSILNLPAMYLAVSLHLISYVFCCILTVLFGLIVTLVMNKTMDVINPVNALKSVE